VLFENDLQPWPTIGVDVVEDDIQHRDVPRAVNRVRSAECLVV
jgi:hypothetical protein